MKKIAVILLIACSLLEAGCSRPAAQAPVVTASPIPEVSDEEQRQKAAATEARQEEKRAAEVVAQPAVPMPENEPALRAQSPSPSP
jgi:hypothetical protein